MTASDEQVKSASARAFSKTELMVTTAARRLEDGDSVLVGVGVPTLAANLAKRIHAPELEMIYESGTIDTTPTSLPLSIGDPVLPAGAQSINSMYETFTYYLQAGRIDVGFLGGAQVDRFGNINSTVIGSYEDPKVRLPGSGGACEIASNAAETVIITPHERRRFPAEVDFITSPGYVNGREGREDLGLPGGPEVVITDKAVMEFDESGEMYVTALHPDVSRADVEESTGWDIEFGDEIESSPTPTDEELRTLREDLDPDGMFLD